MVRIYECDCGWSDGRGGVLAQGHAILLASVRYRPRIGWGGTEGFNRKVPVFVAACLCTSVPAMR